MKKSNWKRIVLIVFIIGNSYGLLCGVLYFFQSQLLFHPEVLADAYTFEIEPSYEEVFIQSADSTQLHALTLSSSNPKGLVLYFHGNAGSLSRWGNEATLFLESGYDVLMPDYRGFGKSRGAWSEAAMYTDSMLWYRYLEKTHPHLPITVYGRSLGTTFATYVASRQSVEQLILETPFYSITDEAQSRFPFLPVTKLLKYHFPTHEFINQVAAPITIIHGTEDEVVSFAHGRKLFESIEASDKRFIRIPDGSHRNLSQFETYQKQLKAILE